MCGKGGTATQRTKARKHTTVCTKMEFIKTGEMSKIHGVQNVEKMKIGILLVNISSSHKLHIATYSLQDFITVQLQN